MSTKIVIAGIAGASLGTEIAKSLALHGDKYEVYGTDISPLAYGHHQGGFKKTFTVSRNDYVADISRVLKENDIKVLIPGGEEPMNLLAPHAAEFAKNGTLFAGNDPAVVATCGDKDKCFKALRDIGTAMPRTLAPAADAEVDAFPFPAIVKPATGSGGSAFVFLAQDAAEAKPYITYIRNNGRQPLLQEYVPEAEGEYTVGVLSLPDGEVWGAIAMRRLFQSKLSVLMRAKAGLISSGYSQGLIRPEPAIEKTCIDIAKAMGSKGPFNVQGRVKNGALLPFEINPRFSASTYLRAMAGFHEIDAYICALLKQPVPAAAKPLAGYYLRTLSETFVPEGAA